MPRTFLTAEWRKLIMAQYVVSPEVLLPYLPRGLELDLYEGRCFVSLVGFLFDRVRLLTVPVPGHTRFEEVNLRFYVRRVMPDGTARRGVIFISEIVPRRAIKLVANTLYGEAYSTARMRHEWQVEADTLHVRYAWQPKSRQQIGPWQMLAARAEQMPQPIVPSSLEEFITEHYWGYTRRRDGRASEYGVEHPRWEMYPVHAAEVDADFGALYGEAFADLTSRKPYHVLLAEGSPVAVRWGGRIS